MAIGEHSLAKMMIAYKRWGDCDVIERGGIDELVELYVKFHAEAEVDKSLEDEARQEFTSLRQVMKRT